jgi:hypothetical protein
MRLGAAREEMSPRCARRCARLGRVGDPADSSHVQLIERKDLRKCGNFYRLSFC